LQISGRIRTRLLVLVTAAALPLLILAAIFLWDRFNEDYVSNRTSVIRAARTAAERIDDHVNDVNTLLLVIGKMISANPADAEKNDVILTNVKADLPSYLNNILLFDLAGNNIGTSQHPVEDRSKLSGIERSYFKPAREGKFTVSEPIISRLNQEWIAVVARPVLDDAGSVRAVIVTGMRLARIAEIVDSTKLPSGSIVRILNENGIVIGRTDRPELTGRDLSNDATVRDQLGHGQSGDEAIWYDGKSRATASVTAQSVPWVVTVGLPGVQQSGAFKHTQWAFVLTLLAVVSVYLLAWLLSSGIVRPIRQLQRDAAIVGSGKTEHRSAVKAEGELGDLVDAFNSMAASLQQRSLDLNRANMQLDAAMDNMSQGLCMFDADRKLVISNDRFRQMYNLTEKQVEPGMPLAQLLQSHVANGETSELSVEEHTRRMPTLPTETFTLADGRVIFIHRMTMPNGGWVATHEDITEQKRVEAMLVEKAREAEQATLAKSEFLSAMSHEIRTPLNGVIGMTGLLLDTHLDPRQRSYAELVKQSGEALLGVINDVLDFSKIEAGKVELEIIDFDLYDVVEGVTGIVAVAAAAKGLELASLIDHDLPTAFRGDPFRLRQVLTNLAANAVKFTEHGEVVLRARLQTKSDDGATIRFEVTDTGIGVSPDQQSHLFEAFTQADLSTTRKYGGTGLGLAICTRLVELMGGAIGVESEPGKGSTFWFSVPLANAPLPAQRQHMDLRGLRVLAVDDNAVNRAILHEHIVGWHMRNGSAESGPRALEMLRAASARGEPYDVAIVDMQMPGMDGAALSRAIKADPAIAGTRLVLLTSISEDAAASNLGGLFDACLTKPARQSALYNCLIEVMAGPLLAGKELLQVEIPDVSHEQATGPAARRDARILVVEDSIVNQQVAIGMLAALGYRADVVTNGLEAIEAAGRIPYAAILMDCQMPEMDGYEATRAIRLREGSRRHTPIIALTADVMRDARAKSLSAGMDDHITKPLKRAELAAALDQSLPKLAVVESPPLAAPIQSDDTVDRTVLDGLRALESAGAPGLVEKLLDSFLEETPRLLADLRQAAQLGDAVHLTRLAHRLRGSVTNLGADCMVRICSELEVLGQGGDTGIASQLVADLDRQFDLVSTALRSEVAKV
jgi:signal transduction histidine kinase/CheY-like chemotaxis protein/HPt (histidine-containing phosphotransfer) domain-containing protein/HAMP domain-containing protein